MIYLYRNDRGESKEFDYPIGTAPIVIFEPGCGEWYRSYTVPAISFDGPDFSINQRSKSPLMRVPKKQRI